MNIPSDVIKQTIDGLKSTPAMLMVVLLNIVMLAGFAYVLHEVAQAQERREDLLKACIERRT